MIEIVKQQERGWQRAALANGAQYDPGAQLSEAITDQGAGVGLRFPLLGSVGSTDVFGGHPVVVIPIDLDGVYDCVIEVYVYVNGLPGDTSDTDIHVGISNESGDQSSATVDGKCGGLRFGSSTKTTLATRVANGTSVIAAGTGATTIRRITFAFPITGTTGLIPGGSPVVVGLDSAGAYASARADDGTTGVVIGTTSKNLCIFGGRTNAANGAAAVVDVDAYWRVSNIYGHAGLPS